MSRERRLALAVAGAALVLRLGFALVTQRHPVFPAYYYTDAEIMHQSGAAMAEALRSGAPLPLAGSPSQRVHSLLLGALYRVTGPRILAAKALNAFVAAAAILLFFEALLPVFGAGPALAAAAVLAVWPSHVFYTSQNFKEAFVFFFLFLSWTAAARLLTGAPRAAAWTAVAVAALLGLGLWRQGLLYAMAAAVIAAALAERRWAALLAAALAALAYRPLSRAVFLGPLALPSSHPDQAVLLRLVVPADPVTQAHLKPDSPENIALLRRLRLKQDRIWSESQRGRAISTQLFPDADFKSWLDVALFVPKAAFYVMFMPLPFFYPLEGKLGRQLAAGENLALLALAAAAVIGFFRHRWTGAKLAFVLFAGAMACGSALFEFDLGGASRHRLHYLPLIFPFALPSNDRMTRRR